MALFGRTTTPTVIAAATLVPVAVSTPGTTVRPLARLVVWPGYSWLKLEPDSSCTM